MPRLSKPLTAVEIKKAKPGEKDRKLFDGGGLYLLVAKTGAKLWRLKYTFDGRSKTFAVGRWPGMSLQEARAKREELRALIAKGIDPVAQKKAAKARRQAEEERAARTFEAVAAESLSMHTDLSEGYRRKLDQLFKRDVYPLVGRKPVHEVTKADLLEIVRHIEARGSIETAHRALTQVARVLRYAVLKEYIPRNPADLIDRKHEMKQHKPGRFAAITDPEELAKLLRMVDGYHGDFTTRQALRLAPYVAVRPFNLRHAEWAEIDFKRKIWTIPGEKMKMGRDHIVPLHDSALEIIEEMRPFSGDSRYIFPSYRSHQAPLSDNTLPLALKRLGYTSDEHTAHGFRSTFATLANERIAEHAINPKIIDIQLAHSAAKGAIEGIYNRAEYLEERTRLMRWWGDYLDGLKR